MRLLFLLPLSLLLFAGCDSGDDDSPFGGGPNATCSSIGATASGSFSGSTPSGSFAPNCFTLNIASDFVLISAQEVVFDGPTVDFEEGVELQLDSNVPGTYAIGFDEETDQFTTATYTTGLVTGAEAESGFITLSSVSGGAAGSFSFTTAAGQTVSGQFNLSL